MSRTLTIATDPTVERPSRALAAAARVAPLLVVTRRALLDLEHELGSYEAAARYLVKIATNTGKPIGVNAPTPEGSRTMFVAPKGWTRERLAGWIAARHQELEAQFGTATIVPSEESCSA
jgi:hypothetical protein